MIRTLALSFVSVVALTGCNKLVSDKIDQSRIWTCYELFYDQNTDRTYATAIFRFSSNSGSILQLSDPSKVLFDSGPMAWDEENGHYEVEITGVQLIGTFEWTDTEGKVYTNSVQIHELSYGPQPDTLYKSDGDNQFTWSGDVIGDDETMVLTIVGSGTSDTREFTNDSLNHTSIKLDSLVLSQVTSGDVTLHLDRKYSPAMQQETERGGKRLGRYRPADRVIFLADSVL